MLAFLSESGVGEEPSSSDGVLSVNAGGQFLFWSQGPGTTASDWFNAVTIAWLFDTELVAWTSYIPALGQTDFALVDGAVLWVVSPSPTRSWRFRRGSASASKGLSRIREAASAGAVSAVVAAAL